MSSVKNCKRLLQQRITALDAEITSGKLSARDRSGIITEKLNLIHHEHHVAIPSAYYMHALNILARFKGSAEMKSVSAIGHQNSLLSTPSTSPSENTYTDLFKNISKQQIAQSFRTRSKSAVESIIATMDGDMFSSKEKYALLEKLKNSNTSTTLDYSTLDTFTSNIQNIEFLTEERLGVNIDSMSNISIADNLSDFNHNVSLRSYRSQKNLNKVLLNKIFGRSFPSKESNLEIHDLEEVVASRKCLSWISELLATDKEKAKKHFGNRAYLGTQHYKVLGLDGYFKNNDLILQSVEKSLLHIAQNGNVDELIITLTDLSNRFVVNKSFEASPSSFDWIRDVMSVVMNSFDPKEDYSKAVVLFRSIRQLGVSMGYSEHIFVPDLIDCLRKWRFQHKMDALSQDDVHLRRIIFDLYNVTSHSEKEFKTRILKSLVQFLCSYDSDNVVSALTGVMDEFYTKHKKVDGKILIDIITFSIQLSNMGIKNNLAYKVKSWSKDHQNFANFDFNGTFTTDKASNTLGLISLIRKSRLGGDSLRYSLFDTLLTYMVKMKPKDPLFDAIVKSPINACEIIIQEMMMHNIRINGAIIFKLLKLFTLACSHGDRNANSKKKILKEMLQFLQSWSLFVDPYNPNTILQNKYVVREVVKCYCLCNDPETAVEYLREMEENGDVDATAYEPLVYYFGVVNGDFNAAKNLCVQIISKPRNLTQPIIDSLIRSCLKGDDLIDVIDYTQDLFNQHNIRPSIQVFQEIMKLAAKSRSKHDLHRVSYVGRYLFPNNNFGI